MISRRDRSSSKRSAGSFSLNEQRDSYEEEDGDTPSGYNYLPPVRQLSLNTTIEGDEGVQGEDISIENYTYLPPPKIFTDKEKHLKTIENQAAMNYCVLPAPKHVAPNNIRSSPWKVQQEDQIHSQDTYSFVPPPRPLTLNTNSRKASDKKEEIKITQSPNSPTADSNYSYVPPPRPLNLNTSSRKASTPDTYDTVPSPKLKNRTGINPWKAKELEDKAQNSQSLQSPTAKTSPTVVLKRNGDADQVSHNYKNLQYPAKSVTPTNSPTSLSWNPQRADKVKDNAPQTLKGSPNTPSKNMNLWKTKEIEETSSQNYSFLPPPKAITPSVETPSTINKDLNSPDVDVEGYDYLPPPSKNLNSAPASNQQTALSADQEKIKAHNKLNILESDVNGYDYLPPPTSPISQRFQTKSPQPIRHFKQQKHEMKQHQQHFDNTKQSNDENYINFAPINQMKMIAKHNLITKPPVVDAAGGKLTADANYINFKF